MKTTKWILPIIVISQFFSTSLWFATNAVMTEMVSIFQLDESALAHLTSAVLFGFITGTLVFATFNIADRFAPSKVFFVSALIGAFFNFLTVFEWNTFFSLFSFRFLTGFFLAGIYPVGMKIAADYYQEGLGKSLGFLVGALVLGTAFPHFLKAYTHYFSWEWVLYLTSILAVTGGILMFFLVPNGPYRKSSPKVDFSAMYKVFQNKPFRAAAFGYFGHMWELFAFWAFVPVILTMYATDTSLNVPIWSFTIIGIGSLACIAGGYLSASFGTKKIAMYSLSLSSICCLICPFIFMISSDILLLTFLLFWGAVVIADSPLFSTLVAQNTSAENKGTALTIVNSIGFAITIISIQVINAVLPILGDYSFLVLFIGPLIGLIPLFSIKSSTV